MKLLQKLEFLLERQAGFVILFILVTVSHQSLIIVLTIVFKGVLVKRMTYAYVTKPPEFSGKFRYTSF